MKNSIAVSEYMLFTKAFSEIMDLKPLGFIEERKEKYDALGSVDCSVFYPDPKLHQIETAKKKSWFGNTLELMKYFMQSKSKSKLEEKYNLMGS